jgi:hypothetical protein
VVGENGGETWYEIGTTYSKRDVFGERKEARLTVFEFKEENW